ncbi:hypothetical protein AB205_0021060, partial [Aquarana catesbeiana]
LVFIIHSTPIASETGQGFQALFYAQDHFMQELFSVCIQVLNKTWKEMRATQEDFEKVMHVLKEQISRTLALAPTTLDLFRTKISSLNYSEILRRRQEERLIQDEALSPPVINGGDQRDLTGNEQTTRSPVTEEYSSVLFTFRELCSWTLRAHHQEKKHNVPKG